jgi:S1-C subfamily serine protease
MALAALAAPLATSCAADPPTAVVGIEVDGCAPGTAHGSGVAVDDDLVLTAAHTLRGARAVVVTAGGRSNDATIVGFDPELDLAYLRVDLGRGVRPIPIDSSAIEDGVRATAWVVRQHEVVPIPVTVERRIRLSTEDIYVDAATDRPGVELRADLLPGDSGGPVIIDGRVVASLWARSRRSEHVAYAIDPDRGRARIDAQLSSGDLGDVDLARCD